MSAKKKPARKSTKKTAADGMVAEVLEETPAPSPR